MTDIKSYKDGDRLIIVLENCTGDLAKKVNAFILDVIGLPTTPNDVPAVLPQKTVATPMPQIDKAMQIAPSRNKAFVEPMSIESALAVAVEGKSGTLGNAIKCNDTEAVIGCCRRAKDMDAAARPTVTRLCKAYIHNDCQKRNPDTADESEIRAFFTLYAPLVGNLIKEILERTGFAALDDFFALTDIIMQQDAYKSVCDCLLQQVS